jgi:hypothetical protein
MVVRGKVIIDNLIEVNGRGGDLTFLTPDVHKYVDIMPLGDPGRLAELYTISFEDIVDYLARLGEHLHVENNDHLRRARELSYLTAPTTSPLVDVAFGSLWRPFERERVRELAESTVGIAHLEGWVEREILSGSRVAVRCFGARTVHIVAGNSPLVSASSIIRNAILRSDAIIKAPSNDPFSALAIAQTMVDIAPDHPLTKHLTVAYWRGGDSNFDETRSPIHSTWPGAHFT